MVWVVCCSSVKICVLLIVAVNVSRSDSWWIVGESPADELVSATDEMVSVPGFSQVIDEVEVPRAVRVSVEFRNSPSPTCPLMAIVIVSESLETTLVTDDGVNMIASSRRTSPTPSVCRSTIVLLLVCNPVSLLVASVVTVVGVPYALRWVADAVRRSNVLKLKRSLLVLLIRSVPPLAVLAASRSLLA